MLVELLVLGLRAHTLGLLLSSSWVATSGVEVVSDTRDGSAADDERSARLGHFEWFVVDLRESVCCCDVVCREG